MPIVIMVATAICEDVQYIDGRVYDVTPEELSRIKDQCAIYNFKDKDEWLNREGEVKMITEQAAANSDNMKKAAKAYTDLKARNKPEAEIKKADKPEVFGKAKK